jgi:hypothetical protein
MALATSPPIAGKQETSAGSTASINRLTARRIMVDVTRFGCDLCRAPFSAITCPAVSILRRGTTISWVAKSATKAAQAERPPPGPARPCYLPANGNAIIRKNGIAKAITKAMLADAATASAAFAKTFWALPCSDCAGSIGPRCAHGCEPDHRNDDAETDHSTREEGREVSRLFVRSGAVLPDLLPLADLFLVYRLKFFA